MSFSSIISRLCAEWFSHALYMKVRVGRYLYVVNWLLVRNIRSGGVLFPWTLLFRVAARIGPLVGFVSAIKVLHIVVSPEYQERIFTFLSFSKLSQDVLLVSLLLLPLFIFLMSACSVLLSRWLSDKIALRMCQDLVLGLGSNFIFAAYLRSKSTSDMASDDGFGGHEGVDGGGASLRIAIEKLDRAERTFLSACELIVVSIVVFLLSAAIHVEASLVMAGVGIFLAGWLIVVNQAKFHAYSSARGRTLEAVKRMVSGNALFNSNSVEGLRRFTQLIVLLSSRGIRLKDNSRLTGMMVQGIVLSSLLFLIFSHSVKSFDALANIGIIIILFRYLISNAQGVGAAASGLVRDYMFLVEISDKDRG